VIKEASDGAAREELRRVLETTGGQLIPTARALNVKRDTVARWARSLGFDLRREGWRTRIVAGKVE
jgi:transcriptional regulator with GAF, ATPase, and Fis domain